MKIDIEFDPQALAVYLNELDAKRWTIDYVNEIISNENQSS